MEIMKLKMLIYDFLGLTWFQFGKGNPDNCDIIILVVKNGILKENQINQTTIKYEIEHKIMKRLKR